ncbi:MAG: acylphosphatase [bacterium]|nr:MAG: acylphosphatase [bacterium]
MDDIRRVHLVVHGRVQGVFFRDSTWRTASELGLEGMVRNLMDGTVEIIAEGPKESLEKLVGWARQGPPASVVEKVDVTYSEPTGEYLSFSIH